MAAWLRPESARRYVMAGLAIVAGFILGTMAVQSWLEGREIAREAREIVSTAIAQGSVSANLFFAETSARLSALESVAATAPANAVRLEPGYRRFDAKGADIAGGPPIPAIADVATRASRTGFASLSIPYERAGRWYAAIVKERRADTGNLEGYEGIEFPMARLREWWSALGLPPGSVVAVLTEDGRIWLREPFVPALVGAPAAIDVFTVAVGANPGHLSRIVERQAEGMEVVVGWRSLESFGLVLVAGVDRAEVAARRPGSMTSPLLLALLSTLAALLLVALTRPRREETVASAPPAPRPAVAPAVPVQDEDQEEDVTSRHGLLRIAENMPVVVFSQRIGPGDRISFDYISPGLRDVHGIEPERLQSRPEIMFEMIHPDDRAQVTAQIRKSWKNGGDLDIEYRIVTPEGDVKWVHNLAHAGESLGPGAGRVWDGIVLDVTAQKLAESELRAARTEAEVTSQVKADFVANVSHELRQPLNAIIGFAEIISQEAYGPVGVEKYLEYARDIHESADYLLAVVNDILDLSKIEAGRATLVLEDLDAAELADSCLRLIHGRAAEARLQLRRFVEPGLPMLRVDPLKVKQILINLLSNSIKFTRPGGTVTLRVISTDDGGMAFSVIDTGIGISETDLATAIESYGQVGPLSGDRSEGTGLGLPLAKALTELHGGQLKIESSAGKGTTVTALFPPGCIASAKSRQD